jgi:Tol biopolymer transport system component
LYEGYGDKYLYDMEAEQILARVHSGIDQERTEVAWSRDGRFAAVVAVDQDQSQGGYRLLAVSRDGEVIQLTDESSGGRILGPSWSPDAGSIAFWISGFAPDVYEFRPAIIQPDTNALTVYCFAAPRSGSSMHRDPVPAPVWSPGGGQIAVMSESSRGEQHSNVIVIDVERGRAYRIAEDAWPVGWMVETP